MIKSAFSTRDVFAHEISHLFGCHHEDRGDPKEDENCAWAYEVRPNTFYTLMHGAPLRSSGKFLLPNLSEPEVDFGGFSTGINDAVIPEYAMNAGRVRETGCQVSAFEPPREMNVIIQGESRFCDNGSYTYQANVQSPPSNLPGQGPYEYTWSWSADGLFPENQGTLLVQNSSSNTITIPNPLIPSCSYIFLHVKVKSSDNVYSYATKKIMKYHCAGCNDPISPLSPPVPPLSTDKMDNECFDELPFNFMHSQFTNHSEVPISIKVVDLTGKRILREELAPQQVLILQNLLPSHSIAFIQVYSELTGCSGTYKVYLP